MYIPAHLSGVERVHYIAPNYFPIPDINFQNMHESGIFNRLSNSACNEMQPLMHYEIFVEVMGMGNLTFLQW